MKFRPLILTGMHRSGTSLLAQFLHASGIDLGDRLLDANESNPAGHYEDVEILAFHRSILWREFRRQLWFTEPPSTTSSDRQEARALTAQRDHKPYWGWKEPRTAFFLEFWRELLPEAGFLFIVRHPAQVVDSLARRQGTRPYQYRAHNTFLRGWLAYNQACLRFYENYPDQCILLILEHILLSPEQFVNTLAARLDYPFDADRFHQLFNRAYLRERPAGVRLFSPLLYRASLRLYHTMTRLTDV